MRRILTLAACATLALSLAAAPEASAARKGGTLRVAIEGNVPHLDGTTALGLPIKFYRETAGASLVMVDEKYNIVGDLARKWEVSDEGRVITFHLHPGAKFHDGTDMDAAAVKWNLDVINQRVQPQWVKELKKKNPKFKFNSSYNLYLNQITKVEAVDKTTVRIHQKDLGKGQLFDAMTGTLGRFVLVSPKAYDTDIESFRRRPVLSGP
ncbi:MAG: hypothetical protein HYY66_10575, partial [Candidatus Tectomicrobia bacterium]|nr:hypothetical protein [Candidatus Tectomicrobia bacterium]